MDDILFYILMLGLGAAVGILSGALGLGGGVLMVPAFMTFAVMDAHTAKGTSLFIIIFVALLNAWRLNRGVPDKPWRLAAFMTIGSIAGSFGGAWLTTLADEATVLWIFIALLVVLAWRTFLIKPVDVDPREVRQRRTASIVIGFVAGLAGGATGTGGGAILVPLALIAGIVSNNRAVGLSNMVMVCTSIAGTIAHLNADPISEGPWVMGHVDFALAPMVFIGAQLGSPLGKRLNGVLELKHRRIAMGILLVVVSARLFYRAWQLSFGG